MEYLIFLKSMIRNLLITGTATRYLFLCLDTYSGILQIMLFFFPLVSDALQELLYPCNVLDVMVVCWAAQPVDRPSASQIVSMTTAPEFTHLLDVISLNDPDSAVIASISFPC